MNSPSKLRPVDHLVLPVADLGVAEARYAALGFAVAPRGQHPFGTVNACIYLADGTFLEPLALSDAATAAQAVREGNVFVGHDSTFRTRVGEEGLSALVFGTQDAVADHEHFRSEQISAGDMLRFSRPFVGADGASGEATFLLAFAADLRAADALFFTCERVGVPAVDRTQLTRHANGAVALKRILLAAPEPHHFEVLLTTLMDHADPIRTEHGFDLQTGTSLISVLDQAAAEALLGVRSGEDNDPTLQFAAVEFAVTDLGATQARLQNNGVATEAKNHSLLVPAAAGQGVPFLFVETRS
jgi:hypothetical protein